MPGDLDRLNEICQLACRKVFWRIIPVLFVSYVLCCMDRYNVAFAQLQLREARDITAGIYGFGATLYFVTYVAFAVPASLLLRRWGARRLFFLIMLGWGICSTGMLFIRTPTEFLVGRLLLGVFEAGFYPGVIYYLGTWFPQTHRSKAFAIFTTGVTVAGVIAGPVSGWIMTRFDGSTGLAGWQWVFLLEGLPSCIMAAACLLVLRRGPADAEWLSKQERHALEEALSRDHGAPLRNISGAGSPSWFRSKQVLMFALVYFCSISGVYALGFWVPAIIHSYGASTPLEIGMYSAIPWGLATVGTILISQHSDRVRERRWHSAGAIIVGAAALALSTIPHLAFPIAMALLSVGAICLIGAIPVFWVLAASVLPQQSAASGVAFINSLGVTSGMIMPLVIGLFKEHTGSLSPGLWCLVVTLFCGAAILLLGTRERQGRSHAGIIASIATRSGSGPAVIEEQ